MLADVMLSIGTLPAGESVTITFNVTVNDPFTGAMAQVLGRGGKTLVAEASGLSRNTVIKAAAEVEAGVEVSVRQRRPGGGGRRAIDKQPGLLAALDELGVEAMRQAECWD